MRANNLYVYCIDKKMTEKLRLPLSAFKKPTNKKEYAALEKILDKLIDIVKNDEKHPLTEAMQIIGDNLEAYDNETELPIGHDLNDIEFVTYLMKSHNLRQEDLADIFGSQGNVSKFLNGERSLSKTQIIGLKNKFKISADFFLK